MIGVRCQYGPSNSNRYQYQEVYSMKHFFLVVFLFGLASLLALPPLAQSETRNGMSTRPTFQPSFVTPATALDLALAMDIPAADIISSNIANSDPAGVGIGTTAIGNM